MTSPLALLVIVGLSGCSAYKWNHVTGVFGSDRIPLDIAITDNVMEIQAHRPKNAPKAFIETNTLHIFATGILAKRDLNSKQCYIQRFDTTPDKMRKRVQVALNNTLSEMTGVKEEYMPTEHMLLLTDWAVKLVLGAEIAEFCRFHEVYVVDPRFTGIWDPESEKLNPSLRRPKRFVAPNGGMPRPSRRGRVIWDHDYHDHHGHGGRRYPWRIGTVVC